MSGWIRLHRSIFSDDDFPTVEPMSEREAWIWLIANVAWKDTKHRVGPVILPVPRGSGFFTLRGLQSTFGWKSDFKVRAYLDMLENTGKIKRTVTQKGSAKKTQLTICNYNKYQDIPQTDNAQPTHNQRTTNALKEQETNKQDIISSFPARDEPTGTQDHFDRFIAAYPNPVQIKSARTAFQFACIKVNPEIIIAGAIRYANKTDDRPWMNPARWLEEECWLDQPAQPPPKQKPISRTEEAGRNFFARGHHDETDHEASDLRNVLQLPAFKGS